VRPLLAQVREELGVPADPLAAYAASGYEARIANERGTVAQTGGYQ
jgi:L-rhamnose isomerase/sugar isomerase